MANADCAIRSLRFREKLRLDPLFRVSRFRRSDFIEWFSFCAARPSEAERLFVALDGKMLLPEGELVKSLRQAVGQLSIEKVPTAVLVGIADAGQDVDPATLGVSEVLVVPQAIQPFSIFGLYTFVGDAARPVEGLQAAKHLASLDALRQRWNEMCNRASRVR